MKRNIILIILALCMAFALVSCGSCKDHTHRYREKIDSEPTCYSLGKRTMECKCGYYYTEEINYKPHSYENGKCTRCGADEALTYKMYDDAGDYYVVTGYTGNSTEITVPKQYNGLLVLKIADNAFKEKNIEKIILPDALKEIGSGAFDSCNALKEVYLPSTLTSLGSSAFKNCTSLKNINMEAAKLTKIEPYTFSGCSSLEKIIINEGVTEIGANALEGTCALKEITIPSTLTKIGSFCFDMYVERVNISSIKNWCSIDFENNLSSPLNGGLASLYLGGEVVKSITIPEGITEIKSFAFFRCGGLEEVVIGNGVNKIGINAFTFCKSLASIYISSSVSEIGEYAFLQCNSLTIKCETNEISSGWDENWNPSGCPVEWNSK